MIFNLFHRLFVCVVMMLSGVNTYAASPDDLLGYWRTFDDMTGFAKSIVQIEKGRNGLYQAKIVEVIPRPNYTPTTHCQRCPAPFTNKKILDLTVIWNLQASTDHTEPLKYQGGYVLDPLSGKIYKTSVTLAEDQRSLRLRGSVVGAPMIGRTQTWRREHNYSPTNQ